MLRTGPGIRFLTFPSSLSSRGSTTWLFRHNFTLTQARGLVVVKSPRVCQLQHNDIVHKSFFIIKNICSLGQYCTQKNDAMRPDQHEAYFPGVCRMIFTELRSTGVPRRSAQVRWRGISKRQNSINKQTIPRYIQRNHARCKPCKHKKMMRI